MLNDIFKYKNNTYDFNGLIPNNYSEIINIYLEINNFSINNPFWAEQQYPFINIRGVNSSNEIKYWIEKYLAAIFIQANILAEIDGKSSHIGMPDIPRTLSDLHFYRDQLNRLKKVIEIIYQDKIVEGLYVSYPDLTIFTTILDDFILNIDNEYDRIKKEQEMDKGKVDIFYQSINKSYTIFKSKIQQISNAKIGDTKRPYTCNLKFDTVECQNKGVFCKDQDIGYCNYDSVFSAMIINNLGLNLGYKLQLHTKKTLSGKYDELFDILDKLNIDENYIVITTKIEFEYFMKKGVKVFCGNKELSYYIYKNIQIIDFAYLKNDNSSYMDITEI